MSLSGVHKHWRLLAILSTVAAIGLLRGWIFRTVAWGLIVNEDRPIADYLWIAGDDHCGDRCFAHAAQLYRQRPSTRTAAIRALSLRMPTYVTLKDVKKRWGQGQEDGFPLSQFEKPWGDMTDLAEAACRFVVVPRLRGQQLKEQAQLDSWLRDGSAAYVDSLCAWE